MPKYLVTVTETYVTEFVISARNKDAAIAVAECRCVDEDWKGSNLLVCERDSVAQPLKTKKETK